MADDLTVCHTCSFRAWAFEGEVTDVTLTITHRNGRTDQVAMAADGDGRWVADGLRLRPGDTVQVAAGGVRDDGGNVNGAAIERGRRQLRDRRRTEAAGDVARMWAASTPLRRPRPPTRRRLRTRPWPQPAAIPPVLLTSVCCWASWLCSRWAAVR